MAYFRAVLLDIDGTLIDSNHAHAKAFEEVFTRHGYFVPFQRIRRCIGMGADKLIPRLLGNETPSQERDAIAKEKTALFMEKFLPELQPFPRANELLVKLKNAGYLLSAASSAGKEELRALLGILGVQFKTYSMKPPPRATPRSRSPIPTSCGRH
jgi:phosphoglycolate phosphatase-like HAD superfamily hydrolase